MKWLQANAAVVLSAIVVIWLGFALVRAVLIASRRRPGPTPTEDFERAEKVKAQIRRAIAARKSNPLPPPPRTARESSARTNPPRGLRPVDPFGGPSRGWWARLRRWLQSRKERNRIVGTGM